MNEQQPYWPDQRDHNTDGMDEHQINGEINNTVLTRQSMELYLMFAKGQISREEFKKYEAMIQSQRYEES